MVFLEMKKKKEEEQPITFILTIVVDTTNETFTCFTFLCDCHSTLIS